MGHQIDSVARLLGNAYAHLQHGIDRGIEWGFSKMQEQAADAPRAKKQKPKGTLGNVFAFGKGFVGVIGEAGEAYYRTYEELKKKGK